MGSPEQSAGHSVAVLLFYIFISDRAKKLAGPDVNNDKRICFHLTSVNAKAFEVLLAYQV